MNKYVHIIITCAFIVVMPLLAVAQEVEKNIIKYDEVGNIKSVEFSQEDKDYGKISTAKAFFRDVLKVKSNNTFVRNQNIRLGRGHETFEQFYKGIRVENAGYTFHYDENGLMKYAHGKYVEISNLDINPTISEERASKEFARYKGFSPNSITQSSAELIIKSIKSVNDVEIPLLVYKVSIAVNNYYVAEYGYVDAKNGIVICSESYIYNAAITSTFITKYYGTKYAKTNWSNGLNYLYDLTRGNGIEVKDLQNHNIYDQFYLNYARPITNGDSIWFYNNYTDSTFMALDVHWAFQMIYDRLYNVHGKNSMDNNGKKIVAYVKAAFSNDPNLYTDNACWFGQRQEFYFGIGSGWNRPVSALDVVAHEYGHGITNYQIGWTSNQRFLNEGLSDIWGAIMDYRFGNANSEVWQIGEYLIPSKICLRDLKSPQNYNAGKIMASTYNSILYNGLFVENDSYGMSGVFSHWFYLLVNGGFGTNENGTYYNLSPVGMDVAENLIVKAVYDNYLRYTTSYEDLRQAFIWTARSMNITGLEEAVCNAWYAVGVGDMYLSLTGPSLINYQGVYSVNGLPNGFYVDWALSDSYYSQNRLQQNYPSTNQCTITRDFNHDMMNATLTANIKYNGVTVQTLTKAGIYAYADFRGHYTSYDLSGDIDYSYSFYVRPNYITDITSQNFYGASVTYDSYGTVPNNWEFSSQYGYLRFIMPTNNGGIPVVINVNDCCGNYYQLYAIPQNFQYLNVSSNDNGITITLNEDGDSERGSILEQAWTVEIRNATTGALMTTLSSTSRSKTISTAGWPKGIYAVKAIVGKEELTEKVFVK